MAGYISRQSTITDGNVGYSSLWNDEYNQILLAFASSTGHKHDGTSGEGGYVPLIADSDKKNYIEANQSSDVLDFYVEVATVATKQLSIADGAILPTTDDDVDLGSATYEFKDLYIDGVANIDSLVADTADINGGTFDGIVGGTTPAAGTFTALTATSGTITGITDLAVADGGTGSSTASDARTALGVDVAGTDNSTDVTLAGTPDYITISGQVVTRGLVNLTTDVTGDLPIAEGGTGSSTASAARTALGLAIGTDIQAYDADLTTWGAKAIPTGTVVGTSDTQALANKTLEGNSTSVGDSTGTANIKLKAGTGYQASMTMYENDVGKGNILYDSSLNAVRIYNITSTENLLLLDTGGITYEGNHITHSDGTTGGTGSAGSGNQYIELVIDGTTYKVLHDGTA